MIRVTDLNIEFFDHERPETVVYDFDLTLHECAGNRRASEQEGHEKKRRDSV